MPLFMMPEQKQELLAYLDNLIYRSTVHYAYKMFKAKGLDTKTAWAAAKQQRDRKNNE